MKRNYRTGGNVLKEIDEEQSALDKMSFGAAFRKARAGKGSGESFTWRGNTYSTNVEKEGYSPRKLGEEGGETRGPTGRRGPTRTVTVSTKREDKTPGRRFTGTYGETSEALSSLSPEQKKAALAAGVGTAASMAAVPALGAAGAVGRTGTVGVRGMTLAQRERDAAAAAEYAQRMKRLKDTAEARARMGRGSTYKHGGSVKKYAGGGSVSSASRRADGIAKKGKTRGKIC